MDSTFFYIVSNFLEPHHFISLKVFFFQSAPGYKVSDFEDGKLRNVEMKHLNPKFQIGAFDIDKMEESDGRLRNELGRQERWRDRDGKGCGKVYKNAKLTFSQSGTIFSLLSMKD